MKRFALIGHPLGHSLSPEIHRAIMDSAGIRGTYDLVDIDPADLPYRIPAMLREYDGFNATIPHKKAVIPFLSGLSDAARRCGAVNTVFEGRGYNTDTVGFRAGGIPLAGARVMLVGTGGVAGMMAAESIAAGAASLSIAPLTPELGNAFKAELEATFPETTCRIDVAADDEEKAAALAQCSVLLNGTPVGMWPKSGGCPVDPAGIPEGITAFDPVYNPTPSRLVLAVRNRGGHATGGLSMLVHQAVAAQKIWNPGLEIDGDAIAAKLMDELTADLYRKNPVKILLTGFMGSGKSTLAKALAKKLNVGFADLDDEIVKAAGKPIPEIFKADGETGFRKLETQVAEKVLTRPASEVVAAGGGLPTIAASREAVRRTNTLVVLLDAPFDALWRRIGGGTGRPLATSLEETKARYDQRAPIYHSFCDIAVAIAPEAAPEANASRIASLLRASL